MVLVNHRMSPPWQDAAKAKVASTFEKIPSEWRLSDKELHEASKKRRIAGNFILSFLTEDERRIVTTPAEELVPQLATRLCTAIAVVKAFCKTAAIAHQIVRLSDRAHSLCKADSQLLEQLSA
jgi:amidase